MIKLVIDCTCELSVAEAESRGIICLPIEMVIDNAEFRAGDNLNNAEFYEKLAQCKNLPKTMAINPTDYTAVIKPLLDAGDQVFAMSISAGLSGTYNSLEIASKELNSENLRIFNTETFTIAYYALVVEAKKLIDSGATLDELTEKMTALKDRVRIYFIVDNLKNLIKSGRISFAKGLLASALHIKPIVTCRNQKLTTVGQALGYNGAKKLMHRFTTNVDETLPIYYGHAHAPEKAEDFRQGFTFNFAENREIGPVVGTHGGPGCVGLAFFEKETPEAK